MELKALSFNDAGPAAVFLPGIIMPAELRYAALIGELGSAVRAFVKELEVYDPPFQREGHSIEAEVAGLLAAADRAGLERFYLYGHSAGGAISLAFASAHPERLLGLALDEPASDSSAETKATWARLVRPIAELPEAERLPAFMQAQVAPGVTLSPPPAGPAPEWMAARPAGIEAFDQALDGFELPRAARPFAGPVYFSFGSLTNPVWREIGDRLSPLFEDFTAEEYEGLHHLNTSHTAEPGRVAAALRRVWGL